MGTNVARGCRRRRPSSSSGADDGKAKAFDVAQRMEHLGLTEDPADFHCCRCGWCTVVPEKHQAALFFCGQYKGTLKRSGFQPIGCCVEPKFISMKKWTLDCSKVKVLDLKGNPVLISGVATYQATSA